jgi:peptidylprolyl isomerase
MNLISSLLLASLVIAQNAALAQHKAATQTPSHSHAASSTGAHGCIKMSDLSPKIPPLPAGSCPRALYTISRVPAIKLDYISPMENQEALRQTFPLDSSTITLAYVDIKVGSGALATKGKYFSILYTGYLIDGTQFDSSAKNGGEPIVIQYGKHGVIPGWDTGLDGMRVGGQRRLYIPYELAYGANGQPPTIPGKAELIFDVEFVAQADTPPAPKTAPAAPATSTPPPAAKSVPAPAATTDPATAPKSQ